jgi:predicted nucleotidyltransferase
MNISIKNVDEKVFRKFKAVAIEGNKTVGEALNEAMETWTIKNKKILNGIEEIINLAKDDIDVIAVFLFGSYSRGEKNYRDVDIGLLLKDNNRDYIGKKARYWVSDIFDVAILNELPLNVLSRILEEGKILYKSDIEALEDFSYLVCKEWNDFRPFYKTLISVD